MSASTSGDLEWVLIDPGHVSRRRRLRERLAVAEFRVETGRGFLCHLRHASGDTEEFDLGHPGQWETRLGAAIRARFGDRDDLICTWATPWSRMEIVTVWTE